MPYNDKGIIEGSDLPPGRPLTKSEDLKRLRQDFLRSVRQTLGEEDSEDHKEISLVLLARHFVQAEMRIITSEVVT